MCVHAPWKICRYMLRNIKQVIWFHLHDDYNDACKKYIFSGESFSIYLLRRMLFWVKLLQFLYVLFTEGEASTCFMGEMKSILMCTTNFWFNFILSTMFSLISLRTHNEEASSRDISIMRLSHIFLFLSNAKAFLQYSWVCILC